MAMGFKFYGGATPCMKHAHTIFYAGGSLTQKSNHGIELSGGASLHDSPRHLEAIAFSQKMQM